MTELVYTTSGFLVPKSPHYEVYEKASAPLDYLYTKGGIATADAAARTFFNDNDIYTSVQANQLYLTYINDRSFDNFVELVNFATDIFALISCREFFEAQAGSIHISQMSLMMCGDIINGKIISNHQYASVSPSSRFIPNNGVTETKALTNLKNIFKKNEGNSVSWVNVLTPIVEDQAAFVTLFKHIFVDYY